MIRTIKLLLASILIMPAYLFSFGASGPSNTTITATNIESSVSQQPLASFQFCLTPVDQDGQPRAFTPAGGGQVLAKQYCWQGSNGAVTAVVPDVSVASPSGVGYKVQIETPTGISLSSYSQPIYPSGATWSFDSWSPTQTLIPTPSQLASGTDVLSSCTAPSVFYKTTDQTQYVCVGSKYVPVVSGMAALSGDVTTPGSGSGDATVVGINGVILSNLGSGILKLDDTGKPSIAQRGIDYQVPESNRPVEMTSVMDATAPAKGSCLISVSPAAGSTRQLYEDSCIPASVVPAGPGTITSIHLTAMEEGTDYVNGLQNSTLTFDCDGELNTVPVGLFLLTQDNPIPFSTGVIDNTLGSQSTFSANRQLNINFDSRGCSVTFNNASSTDTVALWGEVSYQMGQTTDTKHKYWHAYTGPLTSLAAFADFTVLPTVTDLNGGELESIALFATSSANPYYLEGFTEVDTDGNPTVIANGTEDFFGSGFYGKNSIGGHYSQKWGELYASGVGSPAGLQNPAAVDDTLLWRNFDDAAADNVYFNSTISAVEPNGEVNSDKPGAPPAGATSMKSFVTWWTNDPSAGTVTFSIPSGPIESNTAISFSGAATGATVCSTTDGSTPTGDGKGDCTHGQAGNSVTVTPPVTVEAMATDVGRMDSLPVSASYTLRQLSSYTFVGDVQGYNYVNSTNTATTSAITLSQGDFVFVLCTGMGQGTYTPSTTSSGATWSSLAATYTSGASGAQGFYISSVATAGSATFTCTDTNGGFWGSIQALVYHKNGTSGTLVASGDLSKSSACSNVASCTSGAVSTTQPSLVIFCGQTGDFNPPPAYVAGAIGANTSVMRSTTCEDSQFTTGQTGITASMSAGKNETWGIVGGAFE